MLTLAAALAGHACVALAAPPEADYLAQRAHSLGVEARAGLDLDWLRGVDVAHVHAGVAWEGHGLVAAAAEVAHAVVRTEHLPFLLTDAADLAAWRRAPRPDLTICVADAARASHVAAGLDPARVVTVRNGIAEAPATAPRAETRVRMGVDEATPVILCVGRLTPQKAHDVLIAALARVPGAILWLVGVGELLDPLCAQARALGIDDEARLLGLRGDVPDLLAAADLFVLPSRFEGLPLVALEAMRAGLPVVGTRVPGTAEAVVDGETGLLVDYGDAGALADAMAALLLDRARARALGAAGRRRWAAAFTADRMGAETMTVYERALALAAAGPARRVAAR